MPLAVHGNKMVGIMFAEGMSAVCCSKVVLIFVWNKDDLSFTLFFFSFISCQICVMQKKKKSVT